MFKYPLLVCCFMLSLSLSAQEKKRIGNIAYTKDSNRDTTGKRDKKRVDSEYDLKNYKSDKEDRLIIEVNHTGWLGLPKGITQESLKCIGVNISLMFDKPLGNSPFSFGYGIGFYSHNFHSNANFLYHTDSLSSIVTTSIVPYTTPITLNRYAQKILEVPIELRFRTKTDRQFKIHFGGKIGYVVNDFRSIKDKDGKIRLFDMKNIDKIKYGINFRMGYQQFAITASYYFSEIFVKNKGVGGIMPYSVGIAIIPY